MFLGIMEKLNEFSNQITKWLIEHEDNPLLWIGIFVAFAFLFYIGYNALRKEK